MKSLRVVDTDVKPARWNVAMTAALVELHCAGLIPDTLRFHRYPRSILIGRHQMLARELHADRCLRKGVEIARRVTGGGAVYMGPGVLAWDIVADRSRFGFRLGDASDQICSAMAAGLNRLGLAARFDPPGDIRINGMKVSGSSGGFEGPTLIQQGTILLDFDRSEMADVLKAGPGRVKPAARVASLAGFLGRVPSLKEVKDVLIASICDAWRTAICVDDLREEERLLAEKLLIEEIGTDTFVMGDAVAEIEPMAASARGRRRSARS